MALVQSVRNHAYKIEKFVSLPATSGTTVGISVPAGTMVLAAGFQNTVAVPDITTYTVAVTDGTTTFMSATSFDAATINRGCSICSFVYVNNDCPNTTSDNAG